MKKTIYFKLDQFPLAVSEREKLLNRKHVRDVHLDVFPEKNRIVLTYVEFPPRPGH